MEQLVFIVSAPVANMYVQRGKDTDPGMNALQLAMKGCRAPSTKDTAELRVHVETSSGARVGPLWGTIKIAQARNVYRRLPLFFQTRTP